MGLHTAIAYLAHIRAGRPQRTGDASLPPLPSAKLDYNAQVTDVLALARALGVDMTVVTDLLLVPDDPAAIAGAVAQAATALARTQPRPTHAIRLTPRDLDILHTLGTARMLTAAELEWLHYPGWRVRYWRSDARQDSPAAKPYQVLPHLYTRLAALVQQGYMQQRTRTTAYASTTYTRLPGIYLLTESGAALVGTLRGIDRSELWCEDVRKRSLQNLEHSLAIAQVYAALRCAATFVNEVTITDWQGDHRLAQPQTYDRLYARGYRDKLPVQPDATFLLTRNGQITRVFVELDRGTRPLSTWATKAAAYHAYQQSSQLQTRYGVASFVLLIVAPTQTRLTRIAEELVTCSRTPSADYWLLTADDIHPTTIRGYCQQVHAVTWEPRKLPQGMVEVPKVTLTKVALWARPQPPPEATPVVVPNGE